MKIHTITTEQLDKDDNYIGAVNLTDFHTIKLSNKIEKVIFNHSIKCYFLLAETKSTIIINGDLNIKNSIDVFEIIVNGNIKSAGRRNSGKDIYAYSVTANNIKSSIKNQNGFRIVCRGGLRVAGNIHCRSMNIDHVTEIDGNVICQQEGNFRFGGLNIKGNAKFGVIFSKTKINVGRNLVCDSGITSFDSITAGTITATVIFAGVNPDSRFFAKDTISGKILAGKVGHGTLIN